VSTFTKFDSITLFPEVKFEADTREISVFGVPHHQRVEQVWEWTGWSTCRLLETRKLDFYIDQQAKVAIDKFQNDINQEPLKFPYSRYYYEFRYRIGQFLPIRGKPSQNLVINSFPAELTSLIVFCDDSIFWVDGFLEFNFDKVQEWKKSIPKETSESALKQARDLLFQIIDYYSEEDFVCRPIIHLWNSGEEDQSVINVIKGFNKIILILQEGFDD
jgi:hypothetical protein